METTLQKSSAFPPTASAHFAACPTPSEILFKCVNSPSNHKSLDKPACKTTTPVCGTARNSPGRWFYMPVIPPHSLRNVAVRCRSNLFNLIFTYPGFTSKCQVQLPATWESFMTLTSVSSTNLGTGAEFDPRHLLITSLLIIFVTSPVPPICGSRSTLRAAVN